MYRTVPLQELQDISATYSVPYGSYIPDPIFREEESPWSSVQYWKNPSVFMLSRSGKGAFRAHELWTRLGSPDRDTATDWVWPIMKQKSFRRAKLQTRGWVSIICAYKKLLGGKVAPLAVVGTENNPLVQKVDSDKGARGHHDSAWIFLEWEDSQSNQTDHSDTEWRMRPSVFGPFHRAIFWSLLISGHNVERLPTELLILTLDEDWLGKITNPCLLSLMYSTYFALPSVKHAINKSSLRTRKEVRRLCLVSCQWRTNRDNRRSVRDIYAPMGESCCYGTQGRIWGRRRLLRDHTDEGDMVRCGWEVLLSPRQFQSSSRRGRNPNESEKLGPKVWSTLS